MKRITAGLAFLARRDRLVDRHLDGVGRLGGGEDALGPGEPHAGLERRPLVDGLRLDEPLLLEHRHERRHAVVAEPAGMDRLRDEVVAERVHLHQRRHLGRVAEVVAVDALGQRRRRLRLDRDDPRLRAAAQAAADERERQPGEVRATAGAADEDIRLLAGQRHLLDRLLADDGLVEQDEVEDRPERVLRAGVGDGVLDRLADGEAERAGVVRLLRQHAAAVLRVRARARARPPRRTSP